MPPVRALLLKIFMIYFVTEKISIFWKNFIHMKKVYTLLIGCQFLTLLSLSQTHTHTHTRVLCMHNLAFKIL